MSQSIIFCDFDGTITKEDTIDLLLTSYATEKWVTIEEMWEQGIIGSRECLEKQMDCVEYFSEKMLNNFIDDAAIDESFIPFLKKIKQYKINFYIVSDGFDLFINSILNKYNISGVKVFSNRLLLFKNKFKTFFPYYDSDCEAKSGLCKCNIVKNLGINREIIYIGDGRSDLCGSKHASKLFAKNKLAKYCQDNKRDFISFENFDQILSELDLESDKIVKNELVIR